MGIHSSAFDSVSRLHRTGMWIGARKVRQAMFPNVVSMVAFVILFAAPHARAATSDPSAVALTRCLDDSLNASTAGQTGCEATARHGYDLRMNQAYAALMKRLPADVRERLRQAQRAWLAFRDADAHARGALYATRRGTMYVPMEAAAETAVTRDRALQLETLLRIVTIDG